MSTYEAVQTHTALGMYGMAHHVLRSAHHGLDYDLLAVLLGIQEIMYGEIITLVRQ